MNKETKHSNKVYPARTYEEQQDKHHDEYEDTTQAASIEKDRAEQIKSDPYKQDVDEQTPEDDKADKRFDEV
jgi:hypothetical protein